MDFFCNFLKSKNDKYFLTLIFAIWIIVQLVLFINLGIVDKNESIRYINNAKLILSDFKIIEFHLFYAFYSILISINLLFFKSFIPVVIFQLFLNAFSTFLFYKIAKRFSSSIAALISTLALILFYQLQQWNFHLYTESIFISEVIIIIYLLTVADLKKLSISIIFISVFTATFFTRPSAVFLVFPILIHLIIKQRKLEINKIGFPIIIIGIILLTAKSIVFNLEYLNEQVNQAIDKTWVIYGYDNIVVRQNPDNKLLTYLSLIVQRFYYFFGLFRPYYSRFHNLSLTFFYPFYVFALYGISLNTKQLRDITILLILIIAAFTTGAVLTFINWQGRFVLPIIPPILILASIGINKILESKLKLGII